MQITEVTTATKVGNFTINTRENKARLRMEWANVSKDMLTSNAGTVYIMVVDGVIKKIGGSVSKGGIKSTMSFYESANCGRPSIRSFGIQQLIFEELEAGKEVEIFLITSEQVIAPVKGLLGKKDIMISAFKEMEENCLSDYVQVEGDFPEWNFQESGRAWDTHIQQLHAQMLSESASS